MSNDIMIWGLIALGFFAVVYGVMKKVKPKRKKRKRSSKSKNCTIKPTQAPTRDTAIEKGAKGEAIAKYYSIPVYGFGKQLSNVYLPLENGETTEIDLLLIHTNGVFVIESKNYSGWIFGDENAFKWTQCLPNKTKQQFYNPIKQNANHVKALQRILEVDKSLFFSVVVFGNDSTLKKITNTNPKVFVIRYAGLANKLKELMQYNGQLLDGSTVVEIYEKLKPYGTVSEGVKQAHVSYVKSLQK